VNSAHLITLGFIDTHPPLLGLHSCNSVAVMMTMSWTTTSGDHGGDSLVAARSLMCDGLLWAGP
jgi:hypothetical protein